MMRTTLNIDDDLLMAVREVAKRESKSVGAVVSDMLRKSLRSDALGPLASSGNAPLEVAEPRAEYGFRPFPKRGGIVTNELIDQLREESGD